MSESLNRRKKVRGGHRTSAKRTIAALYEVIENPDAIITKLEQCKITLTEKLDTLRRLDEEILEQVEDDDVDDEIEQADVCHERIQAAIIDATTAIDSRKARLAMPVVTSIETTDVESSEVSTSASTEPTTTTTSTSIPISHVPVLALPVTTVSSSESLTTPTSIAIASTSHSAATTVIASIELPRLPTPIFSVPSLRPPSASTIPTDHGVSVGDLTLSTPTLPLAGHMPPMSLEYGTKVKLQKLSLKKFNGDITQWSTFWDIFQSSIDGKSGLSNIDKFNYLKSLLEGSASEAVSELKLTAANYAEAISILKKRFGNKQQIINKHMENLLGVDSIVSQHNLKGLRHLHDTIESQIRGLRSLGIPATSYGSLLSSVLMTKLPRLIVSREVQDEE